MTDVAGAPYGLAPALASALLHSLWQGGLLAAAAALAFRGMARASAAWRHTIGMAFLAAMALAPAVQFLRFWQDPDPESGGLLTAVSTLGAAADGFMQNSARVAELAVLAWLVGVGAMLLRQAAGLRAVVAMERAPYRSLPPAWVRRVEQLSAALGIARAVSVRVSDDVLAPCTARLLRPVVWVPLSLLTRAPADHLEALLAHEFAHVARRDWLWNGVQRLIETLLFFHPAVWWLGRRVRQEREHACDDLAVAACGDPVALAEALAALERERRSAGHLLLAARGGSLLQRVTRLLSEPGPAGRWSALGLLGAVTVCGVLLITQLGMAGGQLPDMQVRSSTEGALGPGDWREITAAGPEGRRFYRATIDVEGRVSEIYREGGRVRPVDAEVRRWVDGVTRDGVPPPLQEGEKALVALIAAHPAVVARLGAPVVATSAPVNGNVRVNGTSGSADIRIELSGPKGRAVAAVQADLADGAWTLRRVRVR